MKKIGIVALIATLGLALTACKKKTTTNKLTTTVKEYTPIFDKSNAVDNLLSRNFNITFNFYDEVDGTLTLTFGQIIKDSPTWACWDFGGYAQNDLELQVGDDIYSYNYDEESKKFINPSSSLEFIEANGSIEAYKARVKEYRNDYYDFIIPNTDLEIFKQGTTTEVTKTIDGITYNLTKYEANISDGGVSLVGYVMIDNVTHIALDMDYTYTSTVTGNESTKHTKIEVLSMLFDDLVVLPSYQD